MRAEQTWMPAAYRRAEAAHATGVRFSRRRLAIEAALFAVLLALTAWSAAHVKTLSVRPTPLMQPAPPTRLVQTVAAAPTVRPIALNEPAAPQTPESTFAATDAASQDEPLDTRWFDGRRVRPVRTIWMTVTAYSPDAHSCAPFDDGFTATMRTVWTNGMRLVAADPKVLPMHSLVSVPGYHGGEVVPVLDKGGAIKGNRLDVLYPTHQRALRWGVQRIPVTVWDYVD